MEGGPACSERTERRKTFGTVRQITYNDSHLGCCSHGISCSPSKSEEWCFGLLEVTEVFSWEWSLFNYHSVIMTPHSVWTFWYILNEKGFNFTTWCCAADDDDDDDNDNDDNNVKSNMGFSLWRKWITNYVACGGMELCELLLRKWHNFDQFSPLFNNNLCFSSSDCHFA